MLTGEYMESRYDNDDDDGHGDGLLYVKFRVLDKLLIIDNCNMIKREVK
jgi:hypothetical protein